MLTNRRIKVLLIPHKVVKNKKDETTHECKGHNRGITRENVLKSRLKDVTNVVQNICNISTKQLTIIISTDRQV